MVRDSEAKALQNLLQDIEMVPSKFKEGSSNIWWMKPQQKKEYVSTATGPLIVLDLYSFNHFLAMNMGTKMSCVFPQPKNYSAYLLKQLGYWKETEEGVHEPI